MTEPEQRSLILRQRYDLSVPERALIERGLLLAESLGKKEYTCPILGAKFVLIPAGTFMMGSPEDELGSKDKETLHQVKISKPFYLQTTPVTQAQWEKVMGNNPSYFKGDDNLPVECVSWNDVQKFIRKLNKMEGTNKYRLPEDDEWKYACRAGSTTVYCYGDDLGRLGEYAWYDVNSGGRPHPVGQKKPNTWGLYDMHGNVCEWCQDYLIVFQNPSDSITDPVGPSEVKSRMYRSGSWDSDAKDCRLDDIFFSLEPWQRCADIGFRLLRTAERKRYKPDRQESSELERGKLTKKQLDNSKSQTAAKIRETRRDGDFIVYDNGTVLDTRTNLMWAARDNGSEINWANAKSFCENYHGGGYADWRMPTVDELTTLHDESKTYESDSGSHVYLTELIHIDCLVWNTEIDGSVVAIFDFCYGDSIGFPESTDNTYGRALPVRSGK